jgi:hypothetical protein
VWWPAVALILAMTGERFIELRDLGSVPLERYVEGAPPGVACALRTAHALARTPAAYRAFGIFGRSDLDREPFALSCSELVYYVYARCGVELGDEHQRTRLLAYRDPAPYPEGMRRVEADDLRVGDVLVYHRNREVVEREVEMYGRARPGHAVIVVSVEDGLVIGSHGRDSTPDPGLTGVGYRTMPLGFERWDRARSLRAVYRPTKTSTTVLPMLVPTVTATTPFDAQ